MIYPEFITSKDSIGITAPSDGKTDKLDLKRLDNAYHKLSSLGFNIIETKNVRCSILGRSDTSKNRAKYLEELFQNKDIKVIISASGGDFLIEILQYINFDVIKNNPKWFCGYSDNSTLSFIITTKYEIASMYSDNISCFGMNNWHPSINNYLNILKGNIITQNSFSKYQSSYIEYKTSLEEYNLDKPVNWHNLNNEDKINIEGRFIGGCLDCLLSLVGTKYDNVTNFIEKYKNDGIIWFLESCELSSEQLIRALIQLKEAGWFKYSKGIIFGRPILNKSYYNISYQDAIETSINDLKIPIIIDADFGHTAPRMTLINGSYVQINSTKGKGTLKTILK